MLVLSRKAGEDIIIDNDIRVKIISIQNGIVKIGFSAPSHKIILRGELKEAVVDENLKASTSSHSNISVLKEILK